MGDAATAAVVGGIGSIQGAVIGGVDLGELDDETFAEIHQAWLDNCVVFFRDQDITPAEFLTYLNMVGGENGIGRLDIDENR